MSSSMSRTQLAPGVFASLIILIILVDVMITFVVVDIMDFGKTFAYILSSNLQLQFIAIPIRVDRNTTHIGKLLVTKAIGKSTHDPKIRVRKKYFRNKDLFSQICFRIGKT